MPKHFRQCNFCEKNNFSHSSLVVFSVNSTIKKYLNISKDQELFICEDHFLPDDIKNHGKTKRIKDGAVPVKLSLQDFLNCEIGHDYVKTKELDLV